jgi:hypothetical protein
LRGRRRWIERDLQVRIDGRLDAFLRRHEELATRDGRLRNAELAALQRHPRRHGDVATEEVARGARDASLLLVRDAIDRDVGDAPGTPLKANSPLRTLS